MSGIGKYKLADAMRQPDRKPRRGKRGKPEPNHETTTEQIREAKESAEAANAEASTRDHMIDIGRGNQQAGRQGQ